MIYRFIGRVVANAQLAIIAIRAKDFIFMLNGQGFTSRLRTFASDKTTTMTTTKMIHLKVIEFTHEMSRS